MSNKISSFWSGTTTSTEYYDYLTKKAWGLQKDSYYNKSNVNIAVDTSIGLWSCSAPCVNIQYYNPDISQDRLWRFSTDKTKPVILFYGRSSTEIPLIQFNGRTQEYMYAQAYKCLNNFDEAQNNSFYLMRFPYWTDDANNYNIHPITNFIYTKLICSVYILAVNEAYITDGTGNPQTFTWNDYWKTGYTNYPYIVQVYSTCFVNGKQDSFLHAQAWSGYTDKYGGWSGRIEFPFSTQKYTNFITYILAGRAKIWEDTTTDAKFGNGTFITESNLLNRRTNTAGTITTYVVNANNSTKEEIKKIINSYGFIWTESPKPAQQQDLDNEQTHFPNISSTGKTTGKDTSGNDNKTNPTYNWNGKDDARDKGGYTGDDNNYIDKIDLAKPGLTTTGIFNRTFALNGQAINDLADYLWNSDETIFNEIIKGLGLLGGNPIDGLIDLRLYPFEITSKTNTGTSKSIVVGRTDTHINGIEINDYNAVLDLGSCTFFPKFGNFLDYEPFTSASLYIPYVGIVPISTANFMGQTISCKMVVDITTGSCTAIVFANNIPIIYKNGNIGVEIPMTGTNSSEYASRIMGGLTSGATDVTLGAASKNVGQVVSGIGQIAESGLSVNNTMYNTAGSSSPACGLWQPQNCYFIINRPVPIVPDSYGHTVGYACNFTANLSTLSGFTCCYNVDLSSLYASDDEMNEITNLLANGIYL